MPEVTINGPAGRLEGRYSPGRTPTSPMALTLHPHPQHGGTMNNKVVYTLFQVFAQKGYATLRFNFRGVGRSQGRFNRGDGELSDAAAALDWLQAVNPNTSGCWVAGFSFGAWIGMQLLMRRPEVGRFIAVSPPANVYDFAFLAPCPSSGLVLHGDADEVVPRESVEKLVQKLSHQRDIAIDYRVVKGASHFFYEHLPQLASAADDYVKRSSVAPPRVRSARVTTRVAAR